jgi:hypothetical protein
VTPPERIPATLLKFDKELTACCVQF